MFTRSVGAESGAESYAIAGLVYVGVGVALGASAALQFAGATLLLQFLVMDRFDRNLMWYAGTSFKRWDGSCSCTPSIMRNASIGFAQCVRPGGKPTTKHSLDMFHFDSRFTSLCFSAACWAVLIMGPVLAAVRVLYPEHREGVNKNDLLKLYWFLLRHPAAIQGEGPSNGDGLAALGGAESIIYPIQIPLDLHLGPEGRNYWLDENEGRPRLRDMFHDKMFAHRFLKANGAMTPRLVAEVTEGGESVRTFLTPKDVLREGLKLIWKPRYSTMGLGVEHFEGAYTGGGGAASWARGVPSKVAPYIVEEYITSTEYSVAAEWYRCTTLWDINADEPVTGYIWRTRNSPNDMRVQTDIIGGAYCVTSKYTPFVGPREPGTSFDPRTGESLPLDPAVDAALCKGVEQMVNMHKVLGKELWTVGWDVIVRDGQAVFIEFNINNGFFLADHTLDEAEQMANFYSRQFFSRLGPQHLHFDGTKQRSSAR